MKKTTLNVRLPAQLIAEIDAEARERQMSRSDVVRERLMVPYGPGSRPSAGSLDAIADLVGSVEGLPSDMSTRTKSYLKTLRYGRKRAR